MLHYRQGGGGNAGARLRGLATTVSRRLIHHWGIIESKDTVRFVVYFEGYVLREGWNPILSYLFWYDDIPITLNSSIYWLGGKWSIQCQVLSPTFWWQSQPEREINKGFSLGGHIKEYLGKMTIRQDVSLTIWNTGHCHLPGPRGITRAPCLTQSSLSYPSGELLLPEEAFATAYLCVNSSHPQVFTENRGWYVVGYKYLLHTLKIPGIFSGYFSYFSWTNNVDSYIFLFIYHRHQFPNLSSHLCSFPI